MTREEIVNLLKLFKATYPNTKPITDPESTIAAWELVFGDEEADKVYKAARVYIKSKGDYFPSPKAIYELMSRGQLVYGVVNEPPKITAPEAPKIDIRDFLCPGSCVCPYFDSVCFGSKEEYDMCIL